MAIEEESKEAEAAYTWQAFASGAGSRQAVEALEKIVDLPKDADSVRTVLWSKINTQTRYLPFRDYVVDLHTAEKLTAEEVRERRIYFTFWVPRKWKDGARNGPMQKNLDKFLWGKEEIADANARSLMTKDTKRFYLALGVPDTGKSKFCDAFVACLGDMFATDGSGKVLDEIGEPNASPALYELASKAVRAAIFHDEISQRGQQGWRNKRPIEGLKTLTGTNALKIRGIYKGTHGYPNLLTLLFTENEGNLPFLGLDRTEGLLERMVILETRSWKEERPDMEVDADALIADEEFLDAMLDWYIHRCRELTQAPELCEIPPAEENRERINNAADEQMSRAVQFAFERLDFKREDGAHTLTTDVYKYIVDDEDGEKALDGMRQRTLTTQLTLAFHRRFGTPRSLKKTQGNKSAFADVYSEQLGKIHGTESTEDYHNRD